MNAETFRTIAIAFLLGFVAGGLVVNIVWLRNTPQRRKEIINAVIEDDEASASFGHQPQHARSTG